MAMRKGILATLVVAVFTVVLAAPLVQSGGDDPTDLHTIVKDDTGPPSTCALTWTFTPTEDGTWTGHVVNYGMRWIILDMVDDGSGAVLIDRHMYRFAVWGPEFDIEEVIDVVAGHDYSITVTPNGPMDSKVTFEDIFEGSVVPNEPPVAAFTYTVDGLKVSVDASGSDDSDGTIVSYSWDWGDGATSTGMVTDHTYVAPETESLSGTRDLPPGNPSGVYGTTFASDGVTKLGYCTVTITNVDTGYFWVVTSSSTGFYSTTYYAFLDDEIHVEAVNGDLYGEATFYAAGTPSTRCDVILSGEEPPEPFDVVITLTVTDDDGASTSISKTVTINL